MALIKFVVLSFLRYYVISFQCKTFSTQITVDVSKISSVTLPLFLMYFQNPHLVLSHIRFSRLQKMLLVLQKKRFYRKRGSVTMRKHFRLIMATIWYKSFWQNNCLVESRNLWPPPPPLPLQSARIGKREFPQPHRLIFFLISSTLSISSTTANIVISRWKVFSGNPKILILWFMGHGNGNYHGAHGPW